MVGTPRSASSNAAWAASRPRVTSTMARWASTPLPAAAGKAGSRSRAALSLTTGERICQPSTRARKSPGTAAGSTRPRVRLGSALEMTVADRISSPPSSRTPSLGRISATGTPVASWAPRSRAAWAMAKEIWPMPPST